MSKRSVRILLEDILEASNHILAFTDGLTFDSFCQNAMCVSAVVRQLEIIGEASRMIPEEVQQLNPDIPWHQIKGMRNRIIHEYFDVSLTVVWQVIVTNIPLLKDEVTALLFQV